MHTPIRFREYSFDAEAGELIRQDTAGEQVIRLAPQPARLLLLLLEKYPAVVSQEEIRETIWPEVQVDFESSLHYCIRQIRAALDDNAADPSYIETIPRRGYRWIAAPDAGDHPAVPATAIQKDFPVSRKWVLLMAGIIFLAFLLWSLLKTSMDKPSGITPLRVAVMPFQPEEDSSRFRGNDLASQLVEILTGNATFEVIGPTTTVDYASGSLRQLVKAYEIDFVLNGRFSQAQDTSRLLAEIIRATDGAHVWVQRFDASIPHDSIAARISRAVEKLAGLE